MGFGLLFLGWATLLFFKVIPVGIIGCILMLRGLNMLVEYNTSFKAAKNACIAFLVYFTAFGALWVLDFAGIFPFTQKAALVYADELVYYMLLAVYSFFLYKALSNISRDVGFEKGVLGARRSTALMLVFILFTALRVVAFFFGVEGYLRLALFVFEVVWLLYSASFIYSCYMMIATQEIIDEDMKKMREYDEKYTFRTLKKKK